jgi:hypothetical protein
MDGGAAESFSDGAVTPLSAIADAFEELAKLLNSRKDESKGRGAAPLGHVLRRLLLGLRSFWMPRPRFQVRRVGVRLQGCFSLPIYFFLIVENV